MSVDYIVHPVDHEMIDYGIQQGVPVPAALAEGRYPTPEELVTVLDSIPHHSVTKQRIESSGEFEVTLESTARISIQPPWPFKPTTCAAAHLFVTGLISPSAARPWLSMHGDFDLMVDVIRQLTNLCGPQVFFACDDAIPWFVLSPSDELLGPPT